MKNAKIWQSDNTPLDELIESFTVGHDYIIDQKLLPFDIQASLAHAKMLYKVKILNKEELNNIKTGLDEILEKWRMGEFVISKSQEDCHTAIEQYLTQRFGEAGKKIHTGRSRNDQSLAMMRLYAKDRVIEIIKKTELLNQKLKEKIKTADIPMPGYTHMQKAMPTTVAIWLSAYSDAIEDFIFFSKSILKLIDQNPLGSASGFGIENFKNDRDFTSKVLGFAKTQENPIYCSFSRGHFENIILQGLSQLMTISARFANEMLLFTTSEFNFFSLPKKFTTGSSIMPQKANYDVFEIMRGNAKIFASYQNQIQEIILSLGSGYNRDIQLTKEPFVLGINLCEKTIEVLLKIIPEIIINNAVLEKAMTPELYKTNEVYDLVNKGKSFREAYLEVKRNEKLS